MTNEELIGQEFEGVEFKSIPRLPFDSAYTPFIGETGVVVRFHEDPTYCYVKFDVSNGMQRGIHFPTAVVKEQIENRVPIDLGELFNQIKQL